MNHKTLIKIGGSFLLILFLTSCEKTFDTSPVNEIMFARGPVKGIYEIEIWLIDSKGRNQSMAIKKEGDSFSSTPLWSPDGKKIAFIHHKDKGIDQDIESWLKEIHSGKYEDRISSKIYLIDYPGKKEMILTDDSLHCFEFSWSPDGKRLVFAAGEKTIFKSDIYVIEIESRKIEKISFTPNANILPVWSPDGENIAFISHPHYTKFEYVKPRGNSHVYMVNVKSKDLIKLTDNPANDGEISWSPDGRKIAYMSWKDNKDKIFVIDIDTKKERCLTNSSDEESMPQWSPDGKKIAYFSDYMLYLMDSDGKNKEKLTDKTQCYISYEWRLNWSPDSKKIVFVGITPHLVQKKIYWGDIYTIDIESKELKNLTNTPDRREGCPSWRPVVK